MEPDPRFKGMSTNEIATLMILCAKSDDPTDKEFVAACREEIKRRKPISNPPTRGEGDKR